MSKFKKVRELPNVHVEEATKLIHGADEKPRESKDNGNRTVSITLSISDAELLEKIATLEDRSQRKVGGRLLSYMLREEANKHGIA